MREGGFVSWISESAWKEMGEKIVATSADRICTSPSDGDVVCSYPTTAYLSQMSFLKESTVFFQEREGSEYNTKLLLKPSQISSEHYEQFHSKLLWDLWKARRALLNASFLHNLSQKGIQSWLLIEWYVENTEETFLNLFHKYHLQTHRDKTLLSHSRSYFRWRRVS